MKKELHKTFLIKVRYLLLFKWANIFFLFLFVSSCHVQKVSNAQHKDKVKWHYISRSLMVPNIGVLDNRIFAVIESDRHPILSTDNEGEQWVVRKNGLTHLGVICVTVNGENIFAGTWGGVFLSKDRGATWTAVSNGLGNLRIKVMESRGSNVYAGTWGGGLYKYRQSNESWEAVNEGLNNTKVNSIAIKGDTVFCGTNGAGIFVSFNSGKSWRKINNGVPDHPVRAMALSGDVIYAGTEGGGLLVSTNNGEQWISVKSVSDSIITAILFCDKKVFVATAHNGIFFSNDNDANWQTLNDGLKSRAIYTLAEKDHCIYAGSSRSGISKRTIEDLK